MPEAPSRDASAIGALTYDRTEQSVGRAILEPGWKWSGCVRPIAGTDSCEGHHLGSVVSGRMHVVMDDGTQDDAGPGDLAGIAPGNDAWIVGEKPCVWLDFLGADDYAKQ